MSVPVAWVTWPTENGAARSGPPRGWPNAAPTPPSSIVSRRERRPVEVGGGEHGEVAVRIEGHHAAHATSEPSLRCTIVSSSPATTWALVTTSPSPTTKPLPSWMRSHATPSTFTVDGTTASTTGCGMLVDVGGGPTSGAASRAAKTRGNWSSPTRRRSVSMVSGGSGKRSSTNRAIAEVRACRANQPGTSAISGMSTQTPTRTPTTPATTPAARSAERTDRAGQRGVRAARRSSSPRACPMNAVPRRMPRATNSSWAELASSRARSTGGSTSEPTTTPSGQPDPRRDTGEEPEAVAADRGADRAGDEEEVERVQDGLPSRRAWVRKPVCATIRWSGRTDWPSMCHPRCSTSIVSAIPKARLGERLPQLHRLGDLRRVGEQDPARVQRPRRVLHHLPRLGQVEHDAVEVGLVDALVAVAVLDAVPVARSPRKAATFLAARAAKSSRSS